MKDKYRIKITTEKLVVAKTNHKDLNKAGVEFQANTCFVKGGKSHGVRITLYENCSMLLQPKAPIVRNLEHLDMVTQTQYFAEKYVVELVNNIINEKPEIISQMTDQLRKDLKALTVFINQNEIKRLTKQPLHLKH